MSIRWLVKKCCICFCCQWRYCYAILNRNMLMRGICFARSIFGLHCQIWEMDEAVYRVDDQTVVSHDVQPYKGPCQFHHYDEMLCKVLSPISNLSVTVAIGFSNWPFATWFLKLGRSSILKILAGVCFLILSISRCCTDITS